jgi:T5SS/PEP-CTERM-associated repeat protein
VDGAGSTWTNGGALYVGNSGSGTLSVTNGGMVTSGNGLVGYAPGSTGVVVVDGTGSTWTNGGTLYVGNSGSGTLSVSGGGAVTATSLSVNKTSLTAIDVGRGSLLTVGGGTGTITNYGTIRILAGADVPASTTKYAPISAGTWAGGGGRGGVGPPPVSSHWRNMGRDWPYVYRLYCCTRHVRDAGSTRTGNCSAGDCR